MFDIQKILILLLICLVKIIDGAVQLTMALTIDESGSVFVNGERVYIKGNTWTNYEVFTTNLIPGNNIIAIYGINTSGIGGLLCYWNTSLGTSGTSDYTWKQSNTTTMADLSWTTLQYSDSSWSNAVEKSVYGGKWGNNPNNWRWPTAWWIWVPNDNGAHAAFRKIISLPTLSPTLSPTDPTKVPTSHPSKYPTLAPTDPTKVPTHPPTKRPTVAPTKPTKVPTHPPTRQPTLAPTDPTKVPTPPPTKYPTLSPTDPTKPPTRAPTLPTKSPTDQPTRPTSQPTDAPISKSGALNQTSDNQDSSPLTIAMIVLGVLMGLLCIVIVVALCMRERRKRLQMEVRSLQLEQKSAVLKVASLSVPGIVDDSDELQKFCTQHKLEHHYELFSRLGMTVPVLLASQEQDIRDFCAENKLTASDRMKLLNAVAVQKVVEENMATMNQNTGESDAVGGENNEEQVAMAFGEMGRPPRSSTVVVGEEPADDNNDVQKPVPIRLSIDPGSKEVVKEKEKDFGGMLGDSAMAQGLMVEDIVEEMNNDALHVEALEVAARDDIEGDETR